MGKQLWAFSCKICESLKKKKKIRKFGKAPFNNWNAQYFNKVRFTNFLFFFSFQKSIVGGRPMWFLALQFLHTSVFYSLPLSLLLFTQSHPFTYYNSNPRNMIYMIQVFIIMSSLYIVYEYYDSWAIMFNMFKVRNNSRSGSARGLFR